MNLITGNIKDILSIKLKKRHDSYTDQFSRIFMAKMFIISSLIMSVDFFSDKVSCIVPQSSQLTKDFIHSACWIQGFYVYEEMFRRLEESSYYGIPMDIQLDGINEKNELCRLHKTSTTNRNEGCFPMTKQFYLQYQYFPFYIASLAVLFYMPYMIFRVVNNDVISLRDAIRENGADLDRIINTYFNYRVNGGKTRLRVKTLLNLCIKVLYVTANVSAFCLTDFLLYGNYLGYGLSWVRWARMNNSRAHEYVSQSDFPKQGSVLLPALGFCEINEGSKDMRTVFINTNKFVCEISPNILYQYVLSVLWFMFIVSIAVSLLGWIIFVGNFLATACIIRCRKSRLERILYSKLTYREAQYLELIRNKSLPLFSDIVHALLLNWKSSVLADELKSFSGGTTPHPKRCSQS